MNVTLRQLRVFLAVARAHSFSRAGDTIGLTQPAVSRSISELEGELGLKLLDRTTREVVLTEVGRSLATALDRLVADLDDTLQQARQVSEQRRGRVVVASSPTVSTRLMPVYVAECAVRYPDIRMIVRDSVQVDTLQLIRTGGADFGVVVEPSIPKAYGPSHCWSIRSASSVARITRSRSAAVCAGKICIARRSSCSTMLRAAARSSTAFSCATAFTRTLRRRWVTAAPYSAWWKLVSARAWCRRCRCRCRPRRHWWRCRCPLRKRAPSCWRVGMTGRCRRRPKRRGR